jgi:hypothetical protein
VSAFSSGFHVHALAWAGHEMKRQLILVVKKIGCDRCNAYLLLLADGQEQVDVMANVAAIIDAHAARHTFANIAEIVEDLVRMFGTATGIHYSVGLLLHLFSGETKGK